MADKRVQVLMVEDDSEQVLLMSALLDEACAERARFALESAGTLAEGVARLAQRDYDVILCDLNLPDSDGLETLVRLKQCARGIPIVVLTGMSHEEIGLEAIAHGAQDFIPKDAVDCRLLLRSIGFAMERSRLLSELKRLERQRAELRERRVLDAFKDRVLAAFSHELRSPLSIAKVAVDNLTEGVVEPLQPGQGRLVHVVRRQLDRLARLITKVLDFARLEAGEAKFAASRIEPAAALAQLVSDWKATLKRPLTIEVECAQDAPALAADPDLFAQVVGNLLGNAARYARSRVKVSVAPDGGFARLTVADDGPGVPKSKASAIFEPFVQLEEPGARGHDGAGLGLAVCREICARSGGRIWVESSSAGAAFHATFPAWNAPPAKARA